MKAAALAGIIGAIAAALLMTVATSTVDFDHGAAAYVATFRGSRRGLDALLANGDGQFYAAIGNDPTLVRPGVFPSADEAAYRAQRPVFGDLAWIGSLGSSRRVPIALAVLSVLSAGLAVTAVGVVLSKRQVSPFFALGLFALPGALGVVYHMTSEFLALAVVTAGLLIWESRPPAQANGAIVAFAIAGLIREEFLLVPLALIVFALVHARSNKPGSAIVRLSLPFVAYGAWVVFLRLRIGAWPIASRSSRLHAVPFSGLIDALRNSASRGSILIWVAIGAALVVATALWGSRDIWRAVVIAFALLAMFLGPDVWRSPDQFGRVLWPLFVYGSIISAIVVRDWTEARARRAAMSPTRAD